MDFRYGRTPMNASRAIAAPRPSRRSLGLLLTASPLLFGAPLALGLLISIARLLNTPYPYLGWATTINIDAEQIYLGHTLYQSPAVGYTGALYTPLFTAVAGLLNHISLWGGWSVLVVIGASLSLLVLAARLAYAPAGLGSRALRMLGAAGVGTIAYWCVSSMEIPALMEARPDQLAWAFALFGLIAVADFGPSPSRRRVVGASLLLSAAFWTKQPAIGAALLALAWTSVLAALSLIDRRRALLFAGLLAGINLACLAALNLLTHGWELYFNFEMPLAQPSPSDIWPLVKSGLDACLLAAAFVAATWLAGVAAAGATRSGHPRDRLRRLLSADDPLGRRTLLLGLQVIFGFALAVYFRRANNQFVGVVWTLGLLAATGWCVAQRSAATATATGGCVLLFFVLLQLQPIRDLATQAGAAVPTLDQAVGWEETSPEYRAWARSHTLYTMELSDLNITQGVPLYPDYPHIADLLAAGRQPMYFVKALLNRRFEGVTPFPLENGFVAGEGKWEENYLWKLDEVIGARYRAAPGLPQGVLERRPGPERETWMRNCFGPFAVRGVGFRIRHGGGFWCSFSPNRLALVRTPAPASEVLTTTSTHIGGAIEIDLAPRTHGPIYLALEHESAPGWTARISWPHPTSRKLVISTYLHGAQLGAATVSAAKLPRGRRSLRVDLTDAGPHGPGAPRAQAPGVALLAVPAAPATFAIVATSGTTFDLRAARFAAG
jgi:hypothetical protein